MDPSPGGMVVFAVVLLASVVLMAGFGLAAVAPARKERRLRQS